MIYYNRLDQECVWNDQQIQVKNQDVRAAHTYRLDVPHLSRLKLDPVSHTEWAVQHDRESTEHIGERILQSQSNRQAADPQSDQYRSDFDTEAIQYHHQTDGRDHELS
jgi:hypothetical protein